MGRAPRKVMVMELAGLGDNVHLLPALWQVRRHWPEAELHVMVNAAVAGLFDLTPWVDRVWAYPGAPKPGLAANLGWARRLRAERFDCVINTTGSDRSSLLTWATGAPLRIGRRPADGGPPGWARLFTRVVSEPYYAEPMYVQKRRFMDAALDLAPGEVAHAQFHVTVDPALRRSAGIEISDEGRYIHVSPFTSADARELPREQVAALLSGLREEHPGLRIVLSCAGTPRESARMRELLALLREPPWKVFAGTLGVAALAAVIEKSALAFSGDSGSLHLAFMTGAPAVAWFRAHRGQHEWIPRLPRYRVVVAQGTAPDVLDGVSTRALLDAAQAVLAEAAA